MEAHVRATPFLHNATITIVSASSAIDTADDGFLLPPELLCDWTRRVYDCRDSEFIKWTVIVNPQPLDFLVFLSAVACFMKVVSCVLQVLDVPSCFFITFDLLYWIAITALSAFYVIGMLNCVPVTEIRGRFAIYRHDCLKRGRAFPPVYVFYLTLRQRRALLCTGVLSMTIIGLGCGVASGVLEDRGHDHAADLLTNIEYYGMGVIFWAMTAAVLYYGHKFTVVLRYFITGTETLLGLPERSFGIRDIFSKSSPRYLLIMIKITIYGGSNVFALAGVLCCLWAWGRDHIRRMEDARWPHLMAVMWICANSLTFLVKLTLLTFHFRISKAKEVLRDPPLPVTPVGSDSGSEEHDDLERQLNKKSCSPTTKPGVPTVEELVLEQISMTLPQKPNKAYR
ncbi:hypothetical protein BGZ72_006336 [Mortierella alpina]|nr:hypothetical protein BGZ72_006336 [Mortierella alpina]